MQSLRMSVVLYMLNTLLCAVHGHGYLKDPPSRSSMWRFGFNTTKNFNDNELFCGGFSRQQSFGGKCGICGDAYDQTEPRDNEAGGKYASGIISKYYTTGSTVDITVKITANHLGFFEFRLCENNDVSKTITKECLKHLLVNPETGEKKHYFGDLKGDIVTRVKLPENVTCSQCVLQWRYHTGNSWGTDDQESCIGCGPQEEFYGCSDIAISSSEVTNTVSTPETSTLLAILKTSTTRRTTTPAAATTTATTSTSSATTAAATTSSTTTTTVKKQTTTLPITTTASSTSSTAKTTTVPTASTAKTTTVPTAPTADTTRTTTTPSTNNRSCVSLAVPADDNWCNINCNHVPSYCPSTFCHCT